MALHAEAAPALPADGLPHYLAEAVAAAAAAGGARPPPPGARSARNSLAFLVAAPHVRLPWISCQFQLPQEAAVLKAARRSWSSGGGRRAAAAAPAPAAGGQRLLPPPPPQQQQQHAGCPPLPPPAPPLEAPAQPQPGAQEPADGSGPLLLVADTSALLSMLGAGSSVALRTDFTFAWLDSLARAGKLGRALPSHEQVSLVVPDAVMKQVHAGAGAPVAALPASRRMRQLCPTPVWWRAANRGDWLLRLPLCLPLPAAPRFVSQPHTSPAPILQLDGLKNDSAARAGEQSAGAHGWAWLAVPRAGPLLARGPAPNTVLNPCGQPPLRAAIRFFMGRGLDGWGPAGADFLTVRQQPAASARAPPLSPLPHRCCCRPFATPPCLTDEQHPLTLPDPPPSPGAGRPRGRGTAAGA